MTQKQGAVEEQRGVLKEKDEGGVDVRRDEVGGAWAVVVGEGWRTPRPLRVTQSLGLRTIPNRQGQSQPELRYGSRMPSKVVSSEREGESEGEGAREREGNRERERSSCPAAVD